MPNSSFAGRSMAPSSSAATSMAVIAASGDGSDDSGAANNDGAPATHGAEAGNSPAETAAVGGASSISSRAAARSRVAAAGASGSSPVTAVRSRGGGSGFGPSCQVERCNADMGVEKRYKRRHKVCDAHRKADVVLLAVLRQRFCQQCSRPKRSFRLRPGGAQRAAPEEPGGGA